MNDVNLFEQLKSCRLFSNLSDNQIQLILKTCTTQLFRRGEVIRNNEHHMDCLAIVLDGKACVKKGSTVISTLVKNDFFGAAQLFGSSDNPPTDIFAKTECRILCMKKDVILSLISSDSIFAENFISYLTEKIDFLTSRLGTIASGSVSNKIITLICESDTLSVDCSNMSLLAKKLNVGRASLYRAVDTLIEEGRITKSKNTITLLEENYGKN